MRPRFVQIPQWSSLAKTASIAARAHRARDLELAMPLRIISRCGLQRACNGSERRRACSICSRSRRLKTPHKGHDRASNCFNNLRKLRDRRTNTCVLRPAWPERSRDPTMLGSLRSLPARRIHWPKGAYGRTPPPLHQSSVLRKQPSHWFREYAAPAPKTANRAISACKNSRCQTRYRD